MKTKFLTLFIALIAATALGASNTITYTAAEKLSGYNGSLDVGKTTFGPAITSHTFSNGTGTITCRGKIATIGEDAFKYCESLTSIDIPNTVTTIGNMAFYHCSGLTSITIPNSVTSFGDYAFDYCGLKKTNYTGTIADWCKIKFGYSSSNPINNSHNFYINDVEVKDLVIPEGVESIGNYAFYECSSLTSVTIPNSVTTIGLRAFQNCGGLTSVTIPNSVTTIGESAFYNCSSLISVIIGNSVTTIGNYAFYQCSGLTSLTIPNSVTTIGRFAFWFCSGLTSVTIGNSVTTIGEDAFYHCTSLISVTIGNSVTTIGDYAFADCSSLTSVTIPNSVTTIGYAAFVDCTSLMSVTIGKSVTTIGDNAFNSCFGVTSTICYATNPPTCSYYSFYGVDKTIPVYVPAGSVNAYKNANEWKKFANILPIGAEVVPTTEEVITQPTESGVTITWQQTENADTYTLEIRMYNELICTLIFDNQGIMTDITFAAPARGGERTSSNAEMTVDGYKFTVTGLEPGTEYTYTITAKNTSAQPIKTYSGKFTTTGTTGLEDLTIDKKVGNKFIYGNQLYLRRGNKIYNAVGGAVR